MVRKEEEPDSFWISEWQIVIDRKRLHLSKVISILTISPIPRPFQFHRVETPPDAAAEYLPRDRSHSTTLSSSPPGPTESKMPIEQSTRGSNMDFRGRDNADEVDGSAVSRAKEVSQSTGR